MGDFPIPSLGILLFITITLIWIIKKVLVLRRLPPGPWGLPIVGSLIRWLRYNPLHEIEKSVQKYGPIFSVGLGNFKYNKTYQTSNFMIYYKQTLQRENLESVQFSKLDSSVIFINGYKEIREALKLESMSGKASLEMFVHSNGGAQHRGILFSDPIPGWIEQRKFALKTLKSFGVGHQSMDQHLQLNLQDLIDHFKKCSERPVALKTSFCICVINSLWLVLTGKRFDLDDPELDRIIEGVKSSVKHSHMTGPGLFFPFLVKVLKRKFWDMCLKMRADTLSLMRRQVDEHLNTYREDTTRDFIDAYLHEHNQGDSDHPTFTQQIGLDNLVVILKDLFIAGFETTSTTLLWIILYLAEYPEIQKKVQVEIDAQIGRDRPPCREDKLRLCFVEAFVNEVQRKCSVVPLNVYHKVTEDTQFHGKFFPRESVVLFNFYEAHHNVAYWKDPEVFRPERFLDETGTQLIKHEAFMPFSLGRRPCLGEALARDTMFVFVTGLLQQFSFELAPQYSDKKLTEVLTPQFLLHPPDFEVMIKQR